MYASGSEYMVDVDNPSIFIRLHNENCSGMWEKRKGKFHCLNCNAEHADTDDKSTHEQDRSFWRVLPLYFLGMA